MRNTLKALTFLCLAVAGCSKSADTGLKGVMVEKQPSPDGLVAAVSTREDGTDKNPVRWHVYLERAQDPAQAVEVLDVSRSEPPRLRWLDSNGLEVAVECGEINRFANFANVWSGKDKDQANQLVVMLENRGVCPAGPAVPADNTAAR
ncbi:MAG TPA: hypothetical protein VHM27_14470 [Rhizomicrobium sp.]|nr:hypothetical protein [Rhizomicrobium sp.]